MENIKNIFGLIFYFTGLVYAKECPLESGKYGNGIQYQNISCRLFISADKTSADISRNVTVTDSGLIQIFSNFPGTTNSNSTGARVYFLFPRRVEKTIEPSANGLLLTHPSGAVIKFDSNGKMSSQDLKIKMSPEINSKNKTGVEIENYPKGLVFDLGYRMGNTPVLNKNAQVIITDKNNKKCQLINSDIHVIKKDEAILIHKTDKDMYLFLSKRCPQLDLNDLLLPQQIKIDALKSPGEALIAPKILPSINQNDSQRANKQKSDDELGNFIKKVDSNTLGK